ncbi:MAG TPA: hypothetical protein VMK12_29025, partial [Anaeromyxobacteraceae bacterium]|nr:hypothetical protein [Anaeromyxobacteraceae bacterium]
DRDDVRGEKVHETLWVPVGVKDFAFVRQMSKSPSRTATIDVLGFAEGKVADSRFEVPAGYTDMSSHMGGPMGGPGMGGRGMGGPGMGGHGMGGPPMSSPPPGQGQMPTAPDGK